MGVSEKWRRTLPTLLSHDQTYTQEQLDDVLNAHLPKYGNTLRTSVKEALAIATYRTQTAYPVVKLLVCDDAPQFNWLTAQLALCWVHEYRHYKKLMPRFLAHGEILKQFSEDFWKLYRDVLVYRDHPSATQADALRAAFDRLFGQPSGYQQLDERKALTLAKKEPLLMVLSHPEILAAFQSSRAWCQTARTQTRCELASTYSRGHRGVGHLSDAGEYRQQAWGEYLRVFS